MDIKTKSRATQFSFSSGHQAKIIAQLSILSKMERKIYRWLAIFIPWSVCVADGSISRLFVLSLFETSMKAARTPANETRN